MEAYTGRENRVMSTHTPSACPTNLMALLEPSSSSNVLTSQQHGNSLLKQKDTASLGVIKPIKNPRLICALLNHMIEILWNAVSQSSWEALTSYFLNISMRDVCKFFRFVTQKSVS